MKIRFERIALREIRLPLREPFRISSGSVTERRILLLEVEDGDGALVWSECVAPERPNYCPETIDTAWLVIRDYLGPLVMGVEFSSPATLHGEMETNACGQQMAKAALEMAAWGLVAQREGRPLAHLLGGTNELVEVGISIGIQPNPDALVEKAWAAVAAGYRKIKIKIAPGADLEYVGAVRGALGEEAPLAVDANAAYRIEDADHLALLDELGLAMIEQPLARDDLLRHARLQKRLRTPICLDESISSVDRVEDMLALESGRIVNIKPGRVGGFTAAIAIHDLCERADVAVWCGGMLESGIGRSYNVALASLPNFRLPGDLSPSSRYWDRDIVRPEWTMDEHGRVRVPVDTPGLGVEVDVDRIDDLTVRRDWVSAARRP